jgi:hypothetical protein
MRLCTLRAWLAAAALILPGVVTRAEAQPEPPRVVIGVSGGGQGAGSSLSDHFEFERNVETATVDVKYPTRPHTLIDGGIGVRLWKHLGAGVAVSNAMRSGSAEVDARIPPPLQFGQLRTIDGTQRGIDTRETDVHVQVLYAVQTSPAITLTLSAGPSIVHLEQELVNGVNYDEAYPFDVATFRSADSRRAKASAAGFNAGADIRWMFSRSIGLGGLVRYTRGTVDLTTTDNRTLSVQAGGVQGGVGVRIVF